MPSFRIFFKSHALATVLAVVIGCAVPSGFAQSGAAYVQPNFEEKLFVREALLLENIDVETAVKALTALAANFASSEKVDNRLREKALAIALRLNGTHALAREANSMLSEGKEPKSVAGIDTIDEVAQQLWKIAGHLEKLNKTKGEQVLQFCLVDIAREIDPTNLSESNHYPTKPTAQFVGWKSILNSGKTINAAHATKGEFKSIIPTKLKGQVVRINATLKTGGAEPLAITFGNKASELNSRCDALISSLTKLQGQWPQDGGVLTLTVPEASSKDTGLLLPCALLADSLIRKRELDAETVALGIITPEGRLLGANRLHQRLRALDFSEITTILLPKSDLPQLQDIALIGDIEFFFRYQIILVDDLKQAVALASTTERGEAFTQSLQAFDALTKTSTASEFMDVLDMESRHASAMILHAHGSSTLPTRLTLAGSLTALHRTVSPIIDNMKRDNIPDPSAVLAATEQVIKLEPILHSDAASVSSTVSKLLKNIGSYSDMDDKKSETAQRSKAKIISTWNKLRKNSSRLQKSTD